MFRKGKARLTPTATVGVSLGTFLGVRMLRPIPEKIYRRILYSLVLALGILHADPPLDVAPRKT
jgi:uncharacterized membrane protein YfcA